MTYVRVLLGHFFECLREVTESHILAKTETVFEFSYMRQGRRFQAQKYI